MPRRQLIIIALCFVAIVITVIVRLQNSNNDLSFVNTTSQVHAPLFVVTVNAKQGFIDPSGKIVIEPIYDQAYAYSENLAAVKVNGKWGFIDIKGNMSIQPQYAMVGFFSDGLVSFRKSYSDLWGYIDNKGQVVIKPQFDGAYRFHAGIARVGFETTLSKIRTKYADVGMELRYRYVDGTGNFVDQPPPSHYKWISQEELLLIKVGDLHGYCRVDGSVVIKPLYKSALPFEDGLACVYVDGDWGFIDKSGLLVIEPQFRYPSSFAGGLAGVTIDGNNWGFINKSGDFVIEPKFGWVYHSFRHGLAKVLVDRKIGYIDVKGEWVWHPSK